MTNVVQNTPFIALIAYEGVQMSAVLGLKDILEVANRFAAEADVAAITHEVLQTHDIRNDRTFDAVVLPPNLEAARGQSDLELHRWIDTQHRSGATICSACAGAFWLGYAGILDGRPVTTHWALEDEFRKTFPNTQLNPEHLLIDDHDIVTAGGVMAWIDLGVYLIRRWLGADILSKTCRQMLIDPTGREQRNYRSFRPRLTHNDAAIRGLQRWIEGNTDADLSVFELAQRAAMSGRSLQRRFTNATGLTLSRYVQQLRVEKAKGMLERTSLTVAEICWRVGYQDVSAFSRLFKSVSGLSAGDYRKRFSIK
ncbi:MAG: helix-turn-helix domain-containing protein [Rhodobacteraceae bacterium]|nr:helix-turn-helix domain-containing protein [Paracoccaceae bacterium]